MEDKKRNWLIATGAATILCGCPGLTCIIYGSWIGTNEAFQQDITDPEIAMAISVCIGLFLVFVPLAIGGYTWWSNREQKVELEPEDKEPLPPAI